MYFVLAVFTMSLLFVSELKTQTSCLFAMFATSALDLPTTIKVMSFAYIINSAVVLRNKSLT